MESEPPSRRFGRVFVGTPQQARGRSFRVVFVPGLAERMFPQKPREDPLLLDALRTQANADRGTEANADRGTEANADRGTEANADGDTEANADGDTEPDVRPVAPAPARIPALLATQPQRLAVERLLLQIAAGASSERLYMSPIRASSWPNRERGCRRSTRSMS